MTIKQNTFPEESILFDEIRGLIETSRAEMISHANSTLTLLFWQVGRRINEFVLENKRATYGKQIVVTVSRQLKEYYGRNFEEKNLRHICSPNN